MAGYGYNFLPADPYAATYTGYTPHAYGPPPLLDDVRTIFITGFPADVKDRELNNLLRFLPGYVASQMNWKAGSAQGFALFDSVAAARSAIDMISQIQFDEDSVLRCEMARKNMFLKDSPGKPASSPSSFVKILEAAPVTTSPQGFAPVTNTKDNPPCNTLFIGNLGDMVSEAELKGLFGSQPRFRQLKVVRGPRSTTCFIEYADIAAAVAVHERLQGAILSTSERGGIRIQFSKNPFGKKRDGSPEHVAYGLA